MILAKLTSLTRAQRVVGAGETASQRQACGPCYYALYRLSGNVEQPHRHQVRTILKRTFRRLQASRPPSSIVFSVLPGSPIRTTRPPHRVSCNKLLLHHRGWALPFHSKYQAWNYDKFQDAYHLTGTGPDKCACADSLDCLTSRATLLRVSTSSSFKSYLHTCSTSAQASYYVDASTYRQQVFASGACIMACH